MHQAPTASEAAEYLVLCEQHGTVVEGTEDWVCASIFVEEHEEQCPGPVDWYSREDLEFTSAIDLPRSPNKIAERSTDKHHSGP